VARLGRTADEPAAAAGVAALLTGANMTPSQLDS
jgi:hypothetical protein